ALAAAVSSSRLAHTRGGIRLAGHAPRGNIRLARRLAQLAAQLQNLIDQRLLLLPGSLERREPLILDLQRTRHGCLALGGVDADGRLASDDLQLRLQRLDAPLRIL